MTTYYVHPLDISSGTVASSMYYAGAEIHYVTWTGVHGATVDALLDAA